MKYENLIQRSDSEFKRLTGVTPVLFHEMLQVITEAESRKIKSGRPHTLSLADQLLLTLSYLRHYHTQLELAAIYGLSDPFLRLFHANPKVRRLRGDPPSNKKSFCSLFLLF